MNRFLRFDNINQILKMPLIKYLFLLESIIYDYELMGIKRKESPEKKQSMSPEFRDALVKAGKVVREE